MTASNFIAPRLCVSSTGGSGGKTLFSLGLARALTRRGILVKPFKKGPDYIDSAWLSLAASVPTTNLDPFFMEADALRRFFSLSIAKARNNATKDCSGFLALVEGNRGLYDGLDETGSCSTANIARILAAPILICINCAKTTRTIAAILKGLTSFEEGLTFAGVVLNRVASARHEQTLRRAIETCTDIPVLGVLPKLFDNPLPERHMGLASNGALECPENQAALDRLAEIVEKHCDLPGILAAARSTSGFGPEDEAEKIEVSATAHIGSVSNADFSSRVRIGYVQDEALWFHYPENIEALIEAGADVVRLSLFDMGEKNTRNWQNLSALYICGGFPEDYAREIGESKFLASIKAYANAGLPIYAECGGLILLCRELQCASGCWPMAGFFPHTVSWRRQPVGLGYVEGSIIAQNPFFPVGMRLRGHEFHYSSLLQGADNVAMRLVRGCGLFLNRTRGHDAVDGLTAKNVWASYLHIFAPAVPCWAPNMVAAARAYARQQDKQRKNYNSSHNSA